MLALLTRSFIAAVCVVGSLGAPGSRHPDAQNRIISDRLDTTGGRLIGT
jgi:hypothetical protein